MRFLTDDHVRFCRLVGEILWAHELAACKPKPFRNAFNLAIRARREHRGRAKQNGSAIPIHIFIAEINKALIAEATPCLNARGHRFGKRHDDAGFATCQDFLAAIVASIGNGFELVDAEDFLRPTSDVGELRSIRAFVRNLMRDDQVMFRIDCDLHIVADHAGAARWSPSSGCRDRSARSADRAKLPAPC
jgi:hypothetical protein